MSQPLPRQQLRYQARVERKAKRELPPKKAAQLKRNAFKAAKVMFAAIKKAMVDVYALGPIAQRLALQQVEKETGHYRSRGKGRGGIDHRHGRARSAYMPHQGLQERLRRVRGGWAIRPGQPFTKEQAMASVQANRRDRAAHTLLTGERLA